MTSRWRQKPIGNVSVRGRVEAHDIACPRMDAHVCLGLRVRAHATNAMNSEASGGAWWCMYKLLELIFLGFVDRGPLDRVVMPLSWDEVWICTNVK